jgi:hypothetical protein
MEVTNKTYMQYAIVHPRINSSLIWRKNEKVLYYIMHIILNKYVQGLFLYLYKMTMFIFIYSSWASQTSICTYIGVSKSSHTISHRPPTDGTMWMLFAMIESWQRRHSVCQVASLCKHWEFHNTSICHHVFCHICHLSMDVKLEQRANIKFCVILGKSGAETFEMLRRAYGNKAMCQERQNITQRQWEVRATFRQLNPYKGGNNLVACAWGSSDNN